MTRVRVVTGALTVLSVLSLVQRGALALRSPAGPDLVWYAVSLGVALICAALAVLLAARAPRNWCAAVLALGACVVAASASSATSSDTNPWVVALTQGSWMLYYLPLAWLILIFPNGRPLSRRWRLVVIALPVVVVVFNLATAMTTGAYAEPFENSPKVLGSHAGADYIAIAMLPVFLALLIASVISMFRRYRQATAGERVQLRWMALAGLTVPITLLVCWLSYFLLGDADLVVLGLLAMYLTIPAATTIAIVRSTVFDVDQILVRGAVFTAFGILLLASVGAVSAVAGWWAGRGSVALAVGVTALVSITLLPLRHRAERRVSSWLFPDRERVLRSLEELQRDVHSGARAPEALEKTLREALGDPALRVGYRLPGGTDFIDSAGAAVSPRGFATSIDMAGDRIGVVVSSRELLGWSTEIGTVVGFLSELVRLRLETAQALQEVEASRRRLIAAHDEERRRLERDLHDGAQQRLVAVGMALRRTQRRLPDSEQSLINLLDGSVRELQAAVVDLRHIAHGVRPSNLDDGLSAALDSLRSRVGVPLDIDVGTSELPEPVSTTAYFVASEAVTNAIKYASARTIALSVQPSPAGVVVRVRDDGRGGAVVRTGSGLSGLRDRVRAMGGDLSVVSPADHGTLVEAVLPCAS